MAEYKSKPEVDVWSHQLSDAFWCHLTLLSLNCLLRSSANVGGTIISYVHAWCLNCRQINLLADHFCSSVVLLIKPCLKMDLFLFTMMRIVLLLGCADAIQHMKREKFRFPKYSATRKFRRMQISGKNILKVTGQIW